MGVHGVHSGLLTPGDLVLLSMLMIQIFRPIMNLGNIFRMWQDSLVEMNELLKLLSHRPIIEDKPGAKPLQVQNGVLQIKNITYYFDPQDFSKTRKAIDDAERQLEETHNQICQFVQTPPKPRFLNKVSDFIDRITNFDKYLTSEERQKLDQQEAKAKPTPKNPCKAIETLKANAKIPETLGQPGNLHKVFQNFSLNVNPGEVLFVTGVSGSGKTTLFNLLVRMADVQEGEIMIDGQNIKDVTLHSLRSQISFCSQNHYFYNDTIINNLRISNFEKYFDLRLPEDSSKKGEEYHWYEPSEFERQLDTQRDHLDASLENDPNMNSLYNPAKENTKVHPEIKKLAKDFNLMERIDTFENGWEYTIGDHGEKLSGGEKQRLNLIRAFLKDSQIYLFDEPTNFLDSINRIVRFSIDLFICDMSDGFKVMTILLEYLSNCRRSFRKLRN